VSYAITGGLDTDQAMIPKNKPRRSKYAQPSICTFHRWVCTGTHSISHEVRYHIRSASSCGLRVCKPRTNYTKGPLMFTCEREWPFFCHKPITLYICLLYRGCPLGVCPTLTFLLRRTICDHLRRSRPEKILNVFQRIRLRFFQACGLASDRTSFASSRRQCRTGS
jgi:hypothetical protein